METNNRVKIQMSVALKIAGALIAYGILIGQLVGMDARLGRLEKKMDEGVITRLEVNSLKAAADREHDQIWVSIKQNATDINTLMRHK